MQCKFVVAFVVACLAMTASAAPVAEVAVAREPEPLNRASLRLPRIIEEAREPEPVEEAREPEPGCTLYTCIWYVRNLFCLLPLLIQFSPLDGVQPTSVIDSSKTLPSIPSRYLRLD
ncbi:hypothetical protein MVEN_00230900 [Mycena venus]|uniref:Uncharacterized protein n=1 Tax=Mycena venus TaxID=2733690 RepID=A0A8H7DEZ1_9AGAR|nr:hypothetical protein MVEN_00230900 [Mycena venus]